jgi:hypothetical protein
VLTCPDVVGSLACRGKARKPRHYNLTLQTEIFMRSNLILAFLVSAIGLQAAFSSCAPSPTSPVTPNALVARPDTLQLPNLASADTTALSLNCGCRFPLKLDTVIGNRTAIQYTATEPIGDTVTPHTLGFSGVAGTPSGSYTARYVFSGFKEDNFYDTVTVILNVP